MAEVTAKQEKLNIKKTIWIGFGFMAASVAWGIYDPYVTRILDGMLSSSDMIMHWSAELAKRFPVLLEFMEAQSGEGVFTLVPLFIGVIMTFDNIFGVIFQPTFGKLSDRCQSKYGKRRPFIFFGAPISAVLFILIPLMPTLPSLMVVVILFVFVMSLWRAPVVALMPDLTPPHLRSEGNAIINLCGGLGGLIGMVAGSIVIAIFSLFGRTAENQEEYPYVFALAAVIMLISTIVLYFKVDEPDSRLKTQAEQNAALDAQARRAEEKELQRAEKERLKAIKLSGSERLSLVFMLICLFFLFCGTNAIQTFFSLFARDVLGKSTSEATMMMAVFAVFSMIGAIPAGKMGKKFGRKKTIFAGLIAFMSVFVLYLIFRSFALVWVALIIGGFANMMITVNTLPLVLEIGGMDKVGTFTGYYYTATFSAQIASPIVYGFIAMLTGGYMSLFYYCPVMFVLAMLCLLVVRHGEAKIDQDKLEEIVEQVELENAD